MLELIIMANHHLPLVFRMEMHRAAKTVLIHLAVGARALFHPITVAERLETVFPNIKKIILVDVALHITTVNVKTSGDGTVNQNGSDGDASATEIIPVAHLALVRADISLTTEHAADFPLFAGRDNEIHHLSQLLVAELQSIVGSSAANRGNSEQSPCLNLMLNEQLLDGLELIEIHWADASHNVVCRQAFLVGNQIYGAKSVVKAALAFAEGIVRVTQAVEADGDATHSCVHQLLVHGLVVSITIADDTPRETMLPQLPPTFGQVGANQRLTTSDNN